MMADRPETFGTASHTADEPCGLAVWVANVQGAPAVHEPRVTGKNLKKNNFPVRDIVGREEVGREGRGSRVRVRQGV